MEDDPKKTILAFARNIGAADLEPFEIAQQRGWLSEDGNVTDEGRKLLDEMDKDKNERTVLRGNF